MAVNSNTSNHDFQIVTLKKPTWCKLDNDLIYGLVKQGAKCRFCGIIVHRRCVQTIASSICESRSLGIPDSAYCDSEDDEATKLPSDTSHQPRLRAVHPGLSIKNRVTAVLREGWMSYYTNASDVSNRSLHYWRITARQVEILSNNTSTNSNTRNAVLIIPIDSIVAVEENTAIPHAEEVSGNVKNGISGPPFGIQGEVPHVFTIRSPRSIIYAGQDPSYFGKTSDWNELNKGVGRAYGLGWMHTIRQLCFSLPFTSTSKNTDEIDDINSLYDVALDDPESILGSGQFGIVYKAKTKDGTEKEVAIKAIDKKQLESLDKLSLNQFLTTEIRIMREIKHPGIVKLIECINTVEKIYVVMEKAQTDMLDFVLNHPNNRIPERQAKFLIKQIFVALKYLHTGHKMAHCDMKPENVLLMFTSSNNENGNNRNGADKQQEDEFPLVKLADFGYSRIIGDNSFRSSIVGTPAYLAPEVLTNKTPLFNKELDSWSVGIIIYVSLCGVFPYDCDDEGVVAHLHKMAIPFPDDPWKKITPEAHALIRQLIEVNVRHRLTPVKALKHDWFSRDYQAWCDSRALDYRFSKNNGSSNIYEWTNADEEKHWEAHRLANGLAQWQQIGCKL